MHQLIARLNDAQSRKFADQIGDVFKSLPKLPKGLVEFFVKVAPYLALLGAVLSLLSGPILAVLAFATLFTLNPMIILSTIVAAVLALASAVLLFMAFNPLKARQEQGWMLLFWVVIISLVQSAVGLIYNPAGIIGLVIGYAIGFYILYQMRPWYKN